MVAGEASGDHLGADVAAQLLAQAPDCDIFGVAGERMRAVGVRPLIKLESVAGMGGTELAATIGPALKAFRTLVSAIRRDPPDLAILIDFADFNLKFAWFAKRAGIPVLYYVPPQVWAWRRWRIRTLVRRSDRIAVVFPFEAELYASAGGRVSFVGHPLLDRVGAAQDLLALNIDLSSVMQARRWADTRMPVRYGERVLASRGAMARAAKSQGRLKDSVWS